MTFEEYQKEAKKTAEYPKITENFVYPIIGLCGEAGEVANKVKKIFRDDGGKLTEERKNAINHELGDLLWYMSQLATDIGINFEDIASNNLKRLASRQQRKTIIGDGDNR